MSTWPVIVTTVLLSLAIGASTDQRMRAVAGPADSPRDLYLDARYTLLDPPGLPGPADIASGCYAAGADAIRELEDAGAIVDPSYDSREVRNLVCRWAADNPSIAECRFESATVPGLLDMDPQFDRGAFIARLRPEDWSPAGGRFAYVAWASPHMAGLPRRWIATDTCEPFVWDAGEFQIDLREMARSRRKQMEDSGRRQ